MAEDVGVGDQAPDFDLVGTGSKRYSLSDFRGAPLVLAFYPEDFSPICSMQLRSYAAAHDDFSALGATVLGVSPQGVELHEEFSERLGLNFPLLADVDRKVASAYGVLGPLGFYRRCVFVIDSDGAITFAHRTRAGMSFQPSERLLAAIRDAN